MLSIRKIGVIGRTYRHINRYSQIMGVLLKYGFGDLLERLKIDEYIEKGLSLVPTLQRGNKEKKRPVWFEKLKTSERVRMALEELGPACIKLGQALSTRPDLVPVDFVQEFSRLQDKVQSRPFNEIKNILEAEFHSPLEHLFDFFDEKPIASASIGQVHRAHLKNGEYVAVKVQRPGISRIIEVDLEIMLHLATMVEHNIEEIALHRPVKIVEEFARIIEKEIDYINEARNMERFARQFSGDSTIFVPKVFRDMTTERVLTMEFVRGVKVSEIDQLEAAGLDRKVINARGADLFLRQVFDHGFFHADPHPGNIFVLPGNVICLLDFGMVDSIDRDTRDDFVDLLYSLTDQDESRIAQILLRLTERDHDPDMRLFEKEISEFIGQHLHRPLREIEIGKVLHDLLEVASRHQLRIPPGFFIMMKAFSKIEGIALLLDPDFDMIEQTVPFIERVMLERISPQRIARNISRFSSDLIQFIQKFPKDMLEITRLVRQHKMSVRLEYQGDEKMLATYDRISNRISFSIIIAALIIGSALIVISKIPPLFFGVSLIGIIVFVAAAIMGIWLLAAIIKKGGL
ncbi:MAG: AarF/ABC1/UbiB kinase family protein [Desulfobacteraceae bacterium]|nr:AarF/ABC1/UbiB kinase family protein [Desulfobacteraceae bacterium]